MSKVKIKNLPYGPYPTVIVGADVDGRPNYATVGACGVVSQEPVLYVSLKSTHYTTRGVHQNGYFSVNLPSADLVAKTDFCGLISGHATDKSRIFSSFYDELGRAPLISDCPLNYLCRIIRTIPVFDFEMFLGEIVAVHADERFLTDGQPDPQKISPLVMMYPHYYEFGRPVGSVFKSGQALADKSSIPEV